MMLLHVFADSLPCCCSLVHTGNARRCLGGQYDEAKALYEDAKALYSKCGEHTTKAHASESMHDTEAHEMDVMERAGVAWASRCLELCANQSQALVHDPVHTYVKYRANNGKESGGDTQEWWTNLYATEGANEGSN